MKKVGKGGMMKQVAKQLMGKGGMPDLKNLTPEQMAEAGQAIKAGMGGSIPGMGRGLPGLGGGLPSGLSGLMKKK